MIKRCFNEKFCYFFKLVIIRLKLYKTIRESLIENNIKGIFNNFHTTINFIACLYFFNNKNKII